MQTILSVRKNTPFSNHQRILQIINLLQISFLLSTLRHFRNGAKVFKKPFNSKIPLDASMALVVEWQKSLPQLRTTSTVTGMSFWRVKRAVGSQSP